MDKIKKKAKSFKNGQNAVSLLSASLFIILLISCFTGTYFRNIIWITDIALWKDALSRSLRKERVHNNLGLAYSNHSLLGEAIKEYLIALRFNSDNAEAHNNLGNVYSRQGRFNEAAKEYMDALKMKPNLAEVHNNLGNAYFAQGLLAEAIMEYIIVIKLKPDNALVHNNLGNAYKIQGLKDEARKEFETVLKLMPDFIPAQKALEILGRKP